MAMNKQKGNMYAFVTHTWNVIKGICPHDCSYCYMKVFPQNKLRFDKKELNTDLGKDNFIFVGSSTDMWAWNVSDNWIERVLEHCKKYPENTYLFQTKNPTRFTKFYGKFPDNVIFGTTIESNRDVDKNKAPSVVERYTGISQVSEDCHGETMITIEPILDFDLKTLVEWIEDVTPKWVNIGADSKNHNLPEPSKEKIIELIKQLKYITNVKIKDNLTRIIGSGFKRIG